jgi:GNAT superfamily N-acetyltransferase
VTRTLVDLTLERLEQLPPACRACVFWEVGGARRGPGDDAARAAKEAWLSATQLEWGAPGKVLLVDGAVVGYALLAPGHHFPRSRQLAHVPSDDALLLAALWIDPDAREGGLAKVLIQGVLREVHRRGARALEAYGVRSGPLPASCVLPEGFLVANGFEVVHEHPMHPLLRIDMRTTVRWQETVSHALEGVRSALAREPAPVPSGRNPATHRDAALG